MITDGDVVESDAGAEEGMLDGQRNAVSVAVGRDGDGADIVRVDESGGYVMQNVQVLAIVEGHLNATIFVSVLGCEPITRIECFDHVVHGGFHRLRDASLGVSGVSIFI
ncbi:unnamed protein product [Sphenostylis stenocarpa]|uniref:Uncharacterized protein n=1 Tax=Sphenostylis stenocarpa TaxID=92480 RepID=A0AA86RT17_9FABA|nr:unnamed protein product [Sphenostylis stenocarpa]